MGQLYSNLIGHMDQFHIGTQVLLLISPLVQHHILHMVQHRIGPRIGLVQHINGPLSSITLACDDTSINLGQIAQLNLGIICVSHV